MSDLLKKNDGALTYLASPQLTAFPGVRHAFFTRLGGVSQGDYASLNFRKSSDDSPENVRANFTAAARFIGAAPEHIAHTLQKHTDTILTVREAPGLGTPISDQPVDALITDVPGICLTGFYADCQLVMIYDPKRKACAVVHSGWRGVANEIARKTIERMNSDFQCRPADMVVAVGPSICLRCFETDADVPQALNATYGDLIREHIFKEQGKWYIDLKSITYMSLLRNGILPINIDMSNRCTKCDSDSSLFWSHRKHGGARGVHAGMIMLR